MSERAGRLGRFFLWLAGWFRIEHRGRPRHRATEVPRDLEAGETTALRVFSDSTSSVTMFVPVDGIPNYRSALGVKDRDFGRVEHAIEGLANQ